MAKRMKLISQL